MPYPVIENTSISDSDSYTTNHTVILPTDIESGELLLLFLGFKRSAGTDNTLTISGWTQLAEDAFKVSQVYAKKATGSEGASVSVTSATSCTMAAIAVRISGADTTLTAAGILAGAYAGGSGANPDPPSVGSPSSGGEVLWIPFTSYVNDETFVTVYPETGSNINVVSQSPANAFSGSAICTRAGTEASYDPGTYTLSATQSWFSTTIAILAAGGVSGMSVNIGDNLKAVTDMKVNIGDSLKQVSRMAINIGDNLKEVFP